MIEIGIGFFIGAMVGVVVTALCVASSYGNDKEDE